MAPNRCATARIRRRARSAGRPVPFRFVQQLELWLLVGVVLAAIVFGTMRQRARLSRHPIALGALLGIVPGIIGAVIVLVPRTDLVPDDAEPVVWLAVWLAVGFAVIIAATIGVVRR
jgi:hypothetical protein